MRRGRRKAVREKELIRFGISIPADLLKKFDQHLEAKDKQNRSDAIRDLIRDRLVAEAWTEGKGDQIATLTLVYDGQSPDMLRRLAEGKRALGAYLAATIHSRVSTHQDVEVLVLKGPVANIRSGAEAALGVKGLTHGKLVMSAPAAP